MQATPNAAIEVLEWLSSDQGATDMKTALSLIALIPAAAPEANILLMALPLIQDAIKGNLAALQSGLADGSIVPDGGGGFVPASNSKYDPATGRFLNGFFSK